MRPSQSNPPPLANYDVITIDHNLEEERLKSPQHPSKEPVQASGLAEYSVVMKKSALTTVADGRDYNVLVHGSTNPSSPQPPRKTLAERVLKPEAETFADSDELSVPPPPLPPPIKDDDLPVLNQGKAKSGGSGSGGVALYTNTVIPQGKNLMLQVAELDKNCSSGVTAGAEESLYMNM